MVNNFQATEALTDDREKLRLLVKERAFKFGKFALTSGKESSYYFDGKQVTLHPEGACLLGRIIMDKIRRDDVQAVGGPTIGADPIVGSLAVISRLEGLDLKFFIVRKAAKEHGRQKLIEGPELLPSDRVVIVEDVITTGGSVLKAIEAVRETGCTVAKVVVLVDRLEGGSDRLKKMGIPIEPVFTVRDFGIFP